MAKWLEGCCECELMGMTACHEIVTKKASAPPVHYTNY